jgi:hypothetical protein
MFYSANGKFIIKENFETNKQNDNIIIQENFETHRIKTKAKDDSSLDVWHYDVNGNLRTGTKVSKNGNYEIWTGYCYDDNCPNLYGKNQPNLIVDKDGTTFVKKICIDDVCLTKNDIIINKFLSNLMLKSFSTGIENDKIDKIGEMSEGELSLLLANLQTDTDTEFTDEDSN